VLLTNSWSERIENIIYIIRLEWDAGKAKVFQRSALESDLNTYRSHRFGTFHPLFTSVFGIERVQTNSMGIREKQARDIGSFHFWD